MVIFTHIKTGWFHSGHVIFIQLALLLTLLLLLLIGSFSMTLAISMQSDNNRLFNDAIDQQYHLLGHFATHSLQAAATHKMNKDYEALAENIEQNYHALLQGGEVGDYETKIRWAITSIDDNATEESIRRAYGVWRELKPLSDKALHSVMDAKHYGQLAAKLDEAFVAHEHLNDAFDAYMERLVNTVIHRQRWILYSALACYFVTLIYTWRRIAQPIHRTTQALKERELYLHTVLDNTLDAILVLDAQGIIEEFSKRAEQTFGFTAQEMAGQTIGALIPDTAHRPPEEYIRHFLPSNGSSKILGENGDLLALRKNKQLIPIELGVTRVEMGGRQLWVGVARDLSEKKMAEEKLAGYAERLEQQNFELMRAKHQSESANQLKSQFLANMSHELRTPMHAIIGFAKYGIKKAERLSPQEHGENLLEIRDSAEGLLSLLNDLLDLSKLEAGKVEYQMQPCLLSDLTRLVSRELLPLLAQKQIQVEFEDKTDGSAIECDGKKINQVIRNLFSNAIKFAEEKSLIHVEFLPYTLEEKDVWHIAGIVPKKMEEALKTVSESQPISELLRYRKTAGNMASSTGKSIAMRLEGLFQDILESSPIYTCLRFIEMGGQDTVPLICVDREGQGRYGGQVNMANLLNTSVNRIASDQVLITTTQADPQDPNAYRILTTLLINDERSSELYGMIELEAIARRCPDGYVALRISDQGVGIPEDELELVFDKFIQSKKTKTGAGGTGLGLAICREIIQGHHGKIWAENNADGKGSSFTFLLPASQPHIANHKEEAA